MSATLCSHGQVIQDGVTVHSPGLTPVLCNCCLTLLGFVQKGEWYETPYCSKCEGVPEALGVSVVDVQRTKDGMVGPNG